VGFDVSTQVYAAYFAQICSFAAYPLGKCAFARSCIWASETADLVPSAHRSKQWGLFMVATVINPASWRVAVKVFLNCCQFRSTT